MFIRIFGESRPGGELEKDETLGDAVYSIFGAVEIVEELLAFRWVTDAEELIGPVEEDHQPASGVLFGG